MQEYHLCDSEYRFMQVVWDAAPVASGRLVELCAQELGWKKSTTYTVLKKLCEKGIAQNTDSTVTALVPRQQVQAYASEHFVEQTFAGSLPGFLAAFLGGKTISEGEAAQLKALIDKHREG